MMKFIGETVVLIAALISSLESGASV